MPRSRFAAAIAVAALALPAAAQDDAATGDQAMMAGRFEAPPPGWTMPRTAWGDPDLRGSWPLDYLAGTPVSRPPRFGERQFLTDDEYEEAFYDAEDAADRYAQEEQANMMAMGHWNERGHPLRQTSLIVEPADGRIPAMTEEGQRRRANDLNSNNHDVFDTMADFGPFDRCMTRGMPNTMLTAAYNMGIRVWQSPGEVTIQTELIHELRHVYLDGRAPPPASVVYDLGFSVGHWEGDTLVIETTNFRPLMNGTNSDRLHMVEHLTLMNPDQVRYEAWVEDPVVYTGGWKYDFPWQRNDDYGIFEYACHEGNVQVRGYITATSPRFEAYREAAWAAREDAAGD